MEHLGNYTCLSAVVRGSRINVSTAFGKWVVVPALAKFKKKFPDVHLEVHLALE
jgi:DNA-binding transcriptional LysR family regulator